MRGALSYLLLLLLVGSMVFLFHQSLVYPFTPPSKPLCFSLTPRDRYCIYENVCVNSKYGVFVLGNRPHWEVPLVNMRAADKQSDIWKAPTFIPASLVFRETKPQWINRTLLYGYGYSLEHMTHRLVNGLLPAVDMFRHLQMQSDIDLPPEFDLILEERALGVIEEPLSWDFEEVFLGDPREFHLLTLHPLICYPRAILGLNNTCPFPYCAHEHEGDLYDHVRDLVWSQCHLIDPGVAVQGPRTLQIHVVQRRTTRRILGVEQLVEVLKKHGEVGVFELEELDFCEQSRVFFEADVVLAVHGNSMGHMLWMRENSTIIEMNAKGWSSPFFRFILRGLKTNLRYHSVKCKSTSCAVAEELGPAGLVPKDRSLVMDEKLIREIDGHLASLVEGFERV